MVERDVFISHSREEQHQAATICALLEQRGLRCWIAPRDVAPGSVWDEAIVDAIDAARTFLLILSTHANESPYVKNELNHAFAGKKTIFTFRVEDVLPGKSLGFYLARHHWTDGFPPPLEDKVDGLAAAICALLGHALVLPAGAPVLVGVGVAGMRIGVTGAGAIAADAVNAAGVVSPARGTSQIAKVRSALTRTLRRQRLAWSIAAAAVFAAATTATLLLGRDSERRSPEAMSRVARLRIAVAPADQLLGIEPNERNRSPHRPSRTAVALSPDGQRLVFSAIKGETQQLYIRPLDALDPTAIGGTENSDSAFVSPDGQWVGFWKNGELKKVPVSGGPAVTICKTPAISGASWGSNHSVIFTREFEGLWQVSDDGGTPQPLTTLDLKKGEYSHRLPHILPDGTAVLFTIQRSVFRWDNAQIVVRSLITGKQTVLIEGGADARYVVPGYLVYARQGALLAAPFDVTQLKLTGGAVGIVDGVMQSVNTPNRTTETGAAQFSVSDSGALVYVPGGMFPDTERSLVWVDRAGALQSVDTPPRAYLGPRLSPDGQRLAIFTQGTDRNVWLYDLLRGTLTRLTSDGQNTNPVWTPDGTRLAFSSTTTGAANLFWKSADNSGAAQRLTTSEYEQRPGSWHPDGQTLAFTQVDPTTVLDIWTLSLADRDRTARPVVQTAASEAWPEFSPDGHWLAYASDESGRYEIYVQPFPGPGRRHQISAQGGTQPVWSRNGRELFYTVPDPSRVSGKMMTVNVATTPMFVAGRPSVLGGVAHLSFAARGYDASPDGRRFVTTLDNERSPEAPPTQMILVQNWIEELKRRVPTR